MPCYGDRQFPTKTQEEIDYLLTAETLRRAFMGKLKAAEMSAEELQRDYQQKVADALISFGITLIPSQHLADNQFVVSCGVYRAAKESLKSWSLKNQL